MLVKYDDAVILSFSGVYSFDQAQNHGDIRNLKGANICALPPKRMAVQGSGPQGMADRVSF